MLHLPGAGPGGTSATGPDGAAKQPGGSGSAPGATDESGSLVATFAGETTPDPVVLRRAREIALRLALPRPPRRTADPIGASAGLYPPQDRGGRVVGRRVEANLRVRRAFVNEAR